VATLLEVPSFGGLELSTLPRSVEWLEVRADLVGDLDPARLRRHFSGRLMYTLRSIAEGGASSDLPSQRRDRLLAAANHYDLVNLEGERDLSPELLSRVPAEQRMISWHGPASELEELQSRLAEFLVVGARHYRMVPTALRPGDELLPLQLVKLLARSDTIAYANGPTGLWSRILSPFLGSPAIFGAVPTGGNHSDEPSITKLIQDFGLPSMTPVKEIYGIAGNPISHSLSPRLHNAAYRALGHPALFLPFHVESLPEFWRRIGGNMLDSFGMRLNGLTVVSPHKEAALQIADEISPIASNAESANILVRNNGHWRADTTDPDVVFMANREREVAMHQKQAAVVGCGGAGRAIAAALVQSGAEVTLVNRSLQRGNHAAKLLRLPYKPLREFDAAGYDIVVNATPVGRDDNDVPFRPESLEEDAVLIDLVYGSKPTRLVSWNGKPNRVVIDGRDVLLTQVLRQFQLMTGKKMPVAVASGALGRPSPAAEHTNRACGGTK
jgi:3-dehydroquinate dehydratase/shikimate dehydrogenase